MRVGQLSDSLYVELSYGITKGSGDRYIGPSYTVDILNLLCFYSISFSYFLSPSQLFPRGSDNSHLCCPVWQALPLQQFLVLKSSSSENFSNTVSYSTSPILPLQLFIFLLFQKYIFRILISICQYTMFTHFLAYFLFLYLLQKLSQ